MNVLEYAAKYDVTDQVFAGIETFLKRIPCKPGYTTHIDQIKTVLKRYNMIFLAPSKSEWGHCDYTDLKIALNSLLRKEENLDQHNQTLIHEICHAVIFCIFGDDAKSRRNFRGRCSRKVQPHGREWKCLMVDCGAAPKTTSGAGTAGLHEEKLAARKESARLVYSCERCETEIHAKRKWKYPANEYSHRKCGHRFYLKQNNVTGQKFKNPSVS